MAALPTQCSFGEWLEHLRGLARQSLIEVDDVIALLDEFSPMAPLGPMSLVEVRSILARDLATSNARSAAGRSGCVLVVAAESARGLAARVVFVPAMAERLFPEKITQDPLLSDIARRAIDAPLLTNTQRAQRERTTLGIAVGVATEALVVSYPRLDLSKARVRVPSFYALEILRAADGRLADFQELARQAQIAGDTSLDWPAPHDADEAIDTAEFDLASLKPFVGKSVNALPKALQDDLHKDEILRRALQARHLRTSLEWQRYDGYVHGGEGLAAHHPRLRAYSATTLQSFAACPYRFFLQGIMQIHRLQEPQAPESLDALQRGTMVHDLYFSVAQSLREHGLLPITENNRGAAQAIVDDHFKTITAGYHDDLAPVLSQAWDDTLATIRSDLDRWLLRFSNPNWRATNFELAFGIADMRNRDAFSQPAPVSLACGITLRGSIDLVEQSVDATFRAVDYKTGTNYHKTGMLIDGGRTLQPLLYALALESMTGKPVAGGRLDFCTRDGEFSTVDVVLTASARDAAKLVGETVAQAIDSGFLPAAPGRKGDASECTYCDYRPVCGPHQEQRAAHKTTQPLQALMTLREKA